MIGRTTTAAGAVFAVLLMLLGVFAIPSSVSAAPIKLTDQLTTDTGTTTDLGGGKYFFVKFGADAAFGIVWGTDTNVNNVYFVAIKARYLGMAQVYDRNGAPVAGNQTIKIYTMYAVKLDDMLEYNDSNGNGVMAGHRIYQNGEFTGAYNHTEAIYKKVDLNTSWDQSPVTYQETSDSKVWSFDLSARDLSYIPMDNYTGATGDSKLNNLTLAFHLEANMVQVGNATIPQWRVTVQRGMMGNMWFDNVEKMADLQVSGKMISYHVKWDQSIQGWDFDANNSNPSLLMEFGAIVGNNIPPGMAAWMGWAMVYRMNEGGYCRDNTGTVVDNNTEPNSAPRMLSAPTLTFGGDRTRIGMFEWVSNVTVDGQEKQLHAQIMGGVPIRAVGMNGAVFLGFAVLGGISYPGGAMIVHDPTFSSEALVDINSNFIVDGLPVGLLIIGAVIMTIVIIAVVLLVLMEKKPGRKVQQNYERTMSSQPGEWAKYYNKK